MIENTYPLRSLEYEGEPPPRWAWRPGNDGYWTDDGYWTGDRTLDLMNFIVVG